MTAYVTDEWLYKGSTKENNKKTIEPDGETSSGIRKENYNENNNEKDNGNGACSYDDSQLHDGICSGE